MAVGALGLAVTLGTALSWAGLDATRKALVAHVRPTVAVMWFSLAQVPAFGIWVALMEAPRLALDGYAGPGFGAIALHVVANVLLMRALAISPLSATIPFLSLTPVFTTAIAYGVLGQTPTAVQWVGIALVVVGALGVHARAGEAPWRSLLREPGSLMVIGVAVCWSLTANLDRLALEHASLPVHAAIQTAGVGVALLGWLAIRRVPLRVPRAGWPAFGGSVIFATAALALQLWAIQLVLVGLVETLKRAVGMTSSVVVGRFAFGEWIGVGKTIAILTMGVGTALVLLA